MKKHFEVVTIILLCILFAGFPVTLLYGWDLWRSDYFQAGAVNGTIRIMDGVDWQFVGVKHEEDLWSAGHAAWTVGP